MRRTIKIIFFILKIKKKFNLPKKTPIIIWDKEASEDLRYCINLKKTFIMCSRPYHLKEIYITPQIIFTMIKYYRGNIVTAYFCSLINAISPRLVVTMIDNSLKFFEISKFFKNKINFLAIQNAARYDVLRYQYLYKKKKIKKSFVNQFYFDNFFCFGKHEIKHYKKNNININNYKIIGSLQLSNYLNYLKNKKKKLPKTKFDISVVSEGSTNLDQEYGVNNLAFNWTKIITYSIKFAIENGLRFNFIFKREKKRGKGFYESEIKYLKKYLNPKNIEYLLKNCNHKDNSNFSSYDAISKTNVLIGTTSTLLREKIALNGKVLSCNFSGLKIFDFPIKKICFIKNPSYKEFAERLKQIIKMKDKKFLNLIKQDNNFLITNKNEANSELRNYFARYLKA